MKRAVCIAVALLLTVLLAAACGQGGEPQSVSCPASVLFSGIVKELGENSLVVKADEDAPVRSSSDLFSVGIAGAELLDETGTAIDIEEVWLWDRVEIAFDGTIAESYPAQITAQRVKRLPKEALTLERLKELAQKGEDLTWEDFYPYDSQETGSGLMILKYRLAEGGTLWVGGTPNEEKPWYIRLTRGDTTIDEAYIDIRENDIEEFLAGDGTIPQETAQAGEGDYPAAIRVEGQLYLLGQPMPAEVDESAIIGRTTSYTDGWPQQDGETNFSRELDLPYARVEGGIAVLYESEWYFCDMVKRCGNP